jgi:hypothetical protein
MSTRSRFDFRIRTFAVTALVTLAGTLAACVSVTYPVPAERIEQRAGEVLVFGRLRVFQDEREYFPWQADFSSILMHSEVERHLWLQRLGRRAVSAEVRPDPDGSLAIWLAPADYALLGSTTREVAPGAGSFEVVALLRVPAGQVAAYAGDLLMKTQWREGGHLSSSEFGAKTVEQQPLAIARATLEQRLGRLPQAPVVSLWCACDELPSFDDAALATRARELLDRGCRAAQ